LSSKVSSFVTSKSNLDHINSNDNSPINDLVFKNINTNNLTQFTEVPIPSPVKRNHMPVSISEQKPDMTKKTGAIVENVEIMSKIENDYQKKKR
jgi:hypothetical protein